MHVIRQRAYARAGLIGNPSDGYHGKTISVPVRNFRAEVVLYPWEDVELILSQQERSGFSSVEELVHDVQLHGYYGGIRLVKATIKRFYDFCQAQGLPMRQDNFSIRYETDIPRNVGLAGSSAIIIATLRCLMSFYEIELPLEVQPSLALSVETQELGIPAGLQDRVVQVYDAPVYMNFDPATAHERMGLTCYAYEPVDPAGLPPLYVAYSEEIDVAQPTYVVHSDIRGRFERGDPDVHDAMKRLAALAEGAKAAINAGDQAQLSELIDANFDIRRELYPHMLPTQLQMVLDARSTGATAKFAGSGGAIVGTYPDESAYQRLVEKLRNTGCRVIRV